MESSGWFSLFFVVCALTTTTTAAAAGGYCAGTSGGCSGRSSSDCRGRLGCTWSSCSYTGYCFSYSSCRSNGYGQSCRDITNRNSCNQWKNCRWEEEQTGSDSGNQQQECHLDAFTTAEECRPLLERTKPVEGCDCYYYCNNDMVRCVAYGETFSGGFGCSNTNGPAVSTSGCAMTEDIVYKGSSSSSDGSSSLPLVIGIAAGALLALVGGCVAFVFIRQQRRKDGQAGGLKKGHGRTEEENARQEERPEDEGKQRVDIESNNVVPIVDATAVPVTASEAQQRHGRLPYTKIETTRNGDETTVVTTNYSATGQVLGKTTTTTTTETTTSAPEGTH